MVETCSCSLTKHASWTCWDRADFIYICKEKTVMRTNRTTGFYTSFMTETWEKRTCFQKFLFLRIGFLPFRSSASPHSSSRTSCDHLPASLSLTQIGTDQRASKTEAKIIQDMKILWLGGKNQHVSSVFWHIWVLKWKIGLNGASSLFKSSIISLFPTQTQGDYFCRVGWMRWAAGVIEKSGGKPGQGWK